ncbi:hypothetical protein DPX16_19478 [Anabarilius grahami]|uniref:Uncharacterized protein n=1 Tax=Anabarilius grahami TaxID=495550 RepID=A0A3N0Z096_ANAGA|nr:hypothetical protein DPX16_19478 [Anabarilius grahami]
MTQIDDQYCRETEATFARRWSLGDGISSEDVVDEQLKEQQHAQDEKVATAQGLALLRRLVSRYLTTQCTQVSEDVIEIQGSV